MRLCLRCREVQVVGDDTVCEPCLIELYREEGDRD